MDSTVSNLLLLQHRIVYLHLRAVCGGNRRFKLMMSPKNVFFFFGSGRQEINENTHDQRQINIINVVRIPFAY